MFNALVQEAVVFVRKPLLPVLRVSILLAKSVSPWNRGEEAGSFGRKMQDFLFFSEVCITLFPGISGKEDRNSEDRSKYREKCSLWTKKVMGQFNRVECSKFTEKKEIFCAKGRKLLRIGEVACNFRGK